MLTQVLEWAIDCKVRAGALPESVDRSFTLNFPELSVGDQQAIATAINQAAQGLVAFQGLGAVDRKTAAKFVSQMAAQMGIEVDIDEVLDNAEQDAAAKKAEDFTDPDLFGSGNPNRNRKDAGEPGTTTELPPGVSADGAPDGGRERGMNAWCGDHKLDEEKIANAGN